MSDPILLPSSIHAVTVHTDGALVRRRIPLAGVTGQPGAVRILGLPLAAAGRPVRARVCDGTTEVLSCRLVAVTTPPGQADDRALEQAVETASAVVAAAQRRTAAALARLQALSVLDPPARPDGVKGQPPPASPAAARFELLRFRDQQAERLGADLTAARADEEQADERLAQAEAVLNAASATRSANAGEMRLAADLQLRWPATASAGWIELDYIVPGARWAPSYVLRFDRALGSVAIQLRGLVAQRSGEDWSGVLVACATAPLQGWSELPRLPGRRIGRAQPPPASGWRPAPAGAEMLFADWDAFANTHPVAGAGFGRSVPTLASIAECAAPAEEEVEIQRDCDDRCEKKKSMAPPPAPCAASMPAPCPPPGGMRDLALSAKQAPSRRRSAGVASNMLKEASEDEASALGGGGGPKDDYEDAPPPGFDPGTDLLDFAALRLAAADGDGRGRPRPGAGLAEDPHWHQAFAAATRRADDLRPTPPGHQCVTPAQAAVRWDGSLPVDVPADGGWHVVPLAANSSPVQLGLVVVPRESRTAFRSATISNPFDRALPAGPADIYLGEDFLLCARLPEAGPGASATIGLGVEQSLAVARNATYAEESAGMLGGSLHLRHAVRIALHNKAGRPAAVEVRERLPQPEPEVEHCTVKQLKAEPPWEEWRPDDGALPGGRRWKVTLAAGEQREFAYEYRIEIPAKNEVVGGNRREA